ncbi:MAG: pantoate--beta-alanine ligase [Bacteroidia bacterium]
MLIARSLKELHQHLNSLNAQNKIVGFVPTMGALHSGHLHLVAQSAAQNDITVCSIFVNPTQFNNANDFDKYPRNNAKDIELLEQTNVSIVYFPVYDELYPKNQPKLIDYTDAGLFGVFEGLFRPGHFQGVVTVVMRLFNHVQPNRAYFGLKDYQQYLVIKRATPSFFKNLEIVGIETVRNQNGLALSSRNKRLKQNELTLALSISQALNSIKQNVKHTSVEFAKQKATQIINAAGLKLEYFDVCDVNDLKSIEEWGSENKNVAVCAAFMGDVRLIDNLIF